MYDPFVPEGDATIDAGKASTGEGVGWKKKKKNKVLQKLSTVPVKRERAESITKFKVGTVDSFPWRRR